ncbi:MAG: UvrD-helicase domain-containing protein [Syntrophobacterales bacterium]|nr:UvrD-helicase domain-containing protein [Syntrophobacterales bacterium]
MAELIGVRASAGAGKTYQLSLRYLSLLKMVGSPKPENLKSIVAITFTNKAATEMKERILRFLREIAFETPLGQELSKEANLSPKEASAWIETIISHYSDFYVRTIDSLLFTIFRGLSFELGLQPEVEVFFNRDKILETTFEDLLSEFERHREPLEEAISTYLYIDSRGGFYPEEGLKRRLFDLYPKVEWENIEEVRADILKIEEMERSCREAYTHFYSLIERLKSHLKENLVKGLSEDIECEDLANRAFLKQDPLALFKDRAKVSEKEKKALSEALTHLREKVWEWLNCQSERAYSRVGGYVKILNILKDLIKGICHRDGIILGGDYWTRCILEQIRLEGVLPLIYAHFAERFSHFLFDEFQDTSRAQWDALYPIFEDALAHKGSLFVVGDGKQAIFGWRGGDYRIFDEIFVFRNRYFSSVEKPKVIVLNKNFRSDHSLVDFFNRLFKPLGERDIVKNKLAPLALGTQCPDDVKEQFAENVSRSFFDHYQEPHRIKSLSQGSIKIYEAYGDKEEIRAMVRKRLLEDIRIEWERRKDHTEETPIAVLVRRHSEGEEVSSWLLQKGFPVVTERALRLKSSKVVRGILCFLDYLYDFRNLSALYGFLSSGLLKGGPNSEEDLIDGWLSGNYERWREEVHEIKDGLKPLLNRHSPYELIWTLMERIGLHERLKGDLAPHQPFVERLLEVTNQFEIEEGASIAKYLSFWKKGGLEERVGLPENIRAIKILTVHKAKGLEFPVVFIPFTDWRIGELSPIEIHKGRLIHLTGKLSKELEYLKFELRAREAQEILNLFYVALTRAKEAIYCFITCPRGGGLRAMSYWIKETIFDGGNMLCPIQLLEPE